MNTQSPNYKNYNKISGSAKSGACNLKSSTSFLTWGDLVYHT